VIINVTADNVSKTYTVYRNIPVTQNFLIALKIIDCSAYGNGILAYKGLIY